MRVREILSALIMYVRVRLQCHTGLESVSFVDLKETLKWIGGDILSMVLGIGFKHAVCVLYA